MFLSCVTTIELVVYVKNGYKGLSQKKGTESPFEHMQESHAKDGKKESLAWLNAGVMNMEQKKRLY